MPNKRTQDRIKNNLGIIQGGTKSRKCRTPRLETIDKYYNNKQHDHKQDWRDAECADQYVAIKNRKPIVIYPLPKLLTSRLASKLLGDIQFPKFLIEEDEDAEQLVRLVKKSSMFESKCLQACKDFLAYGSVFVRFKLVAGKLKIEKYNPKHCYPVFDGAEELVSLKVQYVFDDPNDLDEVGRPRQKWYRLDLTREADVLYDNPEYEADVEPLFTVVAQNDHNLGFVQGSWWKTTDDKHSPDGESLTEPIHDFADCLSYNLSQSDRAGSYGMDPQLILKGMDDDEIDKLIKSTEKAWHLGREGEAQLLETAGGGLEAAEKLEGRFDQKIQDITRVIILDPEKMVAHAQSAKAMEIMHGPMLDLIMEIRPQLEKGLIELAVKMTVALIVYNMRGAQLAIAMPPQYQPKSLNMDAQWGEVFPKTMQDLQQKVSLILQLTNGNVLSRETGLQRLSKDLEIENIEEEVQKVNTQKDFNSFGGF